MAAATGLNLTVHFKFHSAVQIDVVDRPGPYVFPATTCRSSVFLAVQLSQWQWQASMLRPCSSRSKRGVVPCRGRQPLGGKTCPPVP